MVRCIECEWRGLRTLRDDPALPEWIPLRGFVKASPCYRCGGLVVPTKTGGGLHRIFTPAQTQQIIQMYTDEKKCLSEIAEIMQCAPSTVSRYLSIHGIRLRERGEIARPRKGILNVAEIYEMYHGLHMSGNEIAVALGVHPNTVTETLRRAGIPTRTSAETTVLVNRRKRRQMQAA